MKIVNYRNYLIAFSAIVMLVSLVIIFTLKLNLGIDFTGGALTEVAYEVRPDKTEVETELNQLDLGGYSLREAADESGRDSYILRTRDLTETDRVAVNQVVTGLGTGGEVTRFTSIGPVIGQELKDKAVWAIGGVIIIIVIYVAFAFLGVAYPVTSWIYGFITIFALAHDVLVPTALMAILGHFFGVEVDVLFVMALLAVLGYSVNDTIVVFDRVRENLVKYRTEKRRTVNAPGGVKREEVSYTMNRPFAEVVGLSVNETLLRSINTSLTTFLALVALYFFGGEVTKTFALILMAGVVAGTYSSIFLASPLLVFYADKFGKSENKK